VELGLLSLSILLVLFASQSDNTSCDGTRLHHCCLSVATHHHHVCNGGVVRSQLQAHSLYWATVSSLLCSFPSSFGHPYISDRCLWNIFRLVFCKVFENNNIFLLTVSKIWRSDTSSIVWYTYFDGSNEPLGGSHLVFLFITAVLVTVFCNVLPLVLMLIY
jgi:hypothetical protein